MGFPFASVFLKEFFRNNGSRAKNFWWGVSNYWIYYFWVDHLKRTFECLAVSSADLVYHCLFWSILGK